MAATVSVSLKQISDSASQGEIRGHRVVCDRPEAKGGGDQGPMEENCCSVARTHH
jgi:hypothetical protein